jgi:hypothetical protein
MSTTIGSGQTLTAAVGETNDYEIASGGTLVYDVGAILADITLDPGASFIEVGLVVGGGTMTVAPVTSQQVIDVGPPAPRSM